jgi:F-box/TPR repeat protein Pof3
LKNLHTLRFSGQGNHRLEVAYNLFRKTPALETLVITNLASTNMPIYGIPLKVLVLKGPNIVAVPLPTTLERFTWEPTNTILSHITFGHVMNSHLPSLTHLSLSNVESVSAKWLSSILDSGVDEDEHDNQDIPVYVFTENAVPLQHLSIKGTLDQSTTSLFRRPDSASGQPKSLFTGSARILTPALKHLAIADLPCDDDEIEHLVSYNLRLEYIDLSASNITGASIKMLADGIPTLKHIRADSASRINGRDGIEYAERKGIKVSCSMDKRQFGKKIRYLY